MKSHGISTTYNLENKIKQIDQYKSGEFSWIQKTVKLMEHINFFLTYLEIRLKKLINSLHMEEYREKV